MARRRDYDQIQPAGYDSDTGERVYLPVRPEVANDPAYAHLFADSETSGRYQPRGRPSDPLPRVPSASSSARQRALDLDAAISRSASAASFRRMKTVVLRKAKEFENVVNHAMDSLENKLAPKEQPREPLRVPQQQQHQQYRPDGLRGMRVPGDTDDEVLLGDAYGSTVEHSRGPRLIGTRTQVGRRDAPVPAAGRARISPRSSAERTSPRRDAPAPAAGRTRTSPRSSAERTSPRALRAAAYDRQYSRSGQPRYNNL